MNTPYSKPSVKEILLSVLPGIVVILAFLLLCTIALGQQNQYWPVKSEQEGGRTINCNFGEIHGKQNPQHYHGALDIAPGFFNVSTLAIETGKIHSRGGDNINKWVLVNHEYPPGQYNRRTRYMHITSVVNSGGTVNGGEGIGIILPDDGARHLHFEMWEKVDGQWYKLNPFRNQQDWHLDPALDGGRPVDLYAPEINQVFLKALSNQPNNAASGYQILTSVGGIIEYDTPAGQKDSVRVHFNAREGSTTTGKPRYNPEHEQLIVYGNIGPIVHCRDTGINTNNPGVIGEGMTINKITYAIDQENSLKYDLTFDSFEVAGGPTIGDVKDIFYTKYNTSAKQRRYGNEDYIRLYNADSSQNGGGTGAYLPPHKTIEILREDPDTGHSVWVPVQSNGIWYTKARDTTEKVFETTPADTAGCNDEALYSDGEHTLFFRVEDDASSPLHATEDVQVIVDNFRPYIKAVEVSSGTRTAYRAAWQWQANARQLLLSPQNPEDGIQAAADGLKDIFITITTSEPMQTVQMVTC